MSAAVSLGMNREVSCVENVDLCVRYVPPIPFRLTEIKRQIVPAPNNQQAWLLVAHPCLPLWIRIHIAPIVIEEVALDLRLAKLIQKIEFVCSQIRIVLLDVRIAAHMPRPRGCQRQEICSQCILVRGSICPKRSARLPIRPQPFVVCHSILNDKSLDSVGMR